MTRLGPLSRDICLDLVHGGSGAGNASTHQIGAVQHFFLLLKLAQTTGDGHETAGYVNDEKS